MRFLFLPTKRQLLSNRLCLTVLVLGLACPALAQTLTPPGGVGSNLAQWLRADQVTKTGTNITLWPDQSAGGHSTNSTTGAPQWLSSAMNGKPAIQFSAGNYLGFDGSFLVGTNMTNFYVATSSDHTAGQRFFQAGTDNSSLHNLHIGYKDGTTAIANFYSDDLTPALLSAGNNSGTANSTYGIFSHTLNSPAPSATGRNLYQNGSLLGNVNNTSTLSSYLGAAFGRNYSGVGNNVVLAEVAQYTTGLNDAQRIIIENYLSLRYNIPLNANSYVTGWPASYTNGLLGVGATTSANVQTAASIITADPSYNGLASFTTTTSFTGASTYPSFAFVADNLVGEPTGVATTTAGVPTTAPFIVNNRFNKHFYISKTGNIDLSLSFDYNKIVGAALPKSRTSYVLMRSAAPGGPYTIVTVATTASGGNILNFNLSQSNSNFVTGYYTVGELTTPVQTYYSLQNGNFNDPNTWTFDPAGVLIQNDGTFPNTSLSPVVILNGRTVTAIAAITSGDITINTGGTLVLGTGVTGHTYTSVSGQGKLVVDGPSGLPTASYSSFVASTGGTIQYTGTNFNLPTSLTTYNNLEVNLTAATNVVSFVRSGTPSTYTVTVNGNFHVFQGIFQFNDNANTTTQLILNVAGSLPNSGNVIVDATGSLTVSTADARFGAVLSSGTGGTPNLLNGQYHEAYFHQLSITGSSANPSTTGNLTNNGTITFTNDAVRNYADFTPTGAVNLFFRGQSNSTANFNAGSTAKLYNLVVDKGVDKTYSLTLAANNNFELWGPVSAGRYEGGNYGFTTATPENRKALAIHHGTLILQGNLTIYTLSEGQNYIGGNADYTLGSNSKLSINGTGVAIYTTSNYAGGAALPGDVPSGSLGTNNSTAYTAFSLYGAFQISAGFFGTRNSAGFVFWPNGQAAMTITGGTVDAQGYWDGSGSNNGLCSYTQTGGKVYLRGDRANPLDVNGNYSVTGTYGNPQGGGELHGAVFNAPNPTAPFTMLGGYLYIAHPNGVTIGALAGNTNVTSGTIVFDDFSGNNTIQISVPNVPLPNVIVSNRPSTGRVTLQTNTALNIQGDLNVLNRAGFNGNGQNVQLGGTLRVFATNTAFTAGANFTFYNSVTNTPSFIISGQPKLANQMATGLAFTNLIFNRGNGVDNVPMGKYYTVQDSGAVNPIANVTGFLNIQNGTLDLNSTTLAAQGNVSNAGVITTSTGKLYLTGTNQTIGGAGTYGNVNLADRPAVNNVSLGSNLTVGGVLTLEGATSNVVNLGLYGLYINPSNLAFTNTAFGTTKYFSTAGNASDPGIVYTNLPTGAGPFTYTYYIGNASGYRPAFATLSNVTAPGSLGIAASPSQYAGLAGGTGWAAQVFWKASPSGGLAGNVAYTFNSYVAADFAGFAGATIYPGKVASSTGHRFYYTTGTLTNGATKVIGFAGNSTPNTAEGNVAFPVETAYYTAGDLSYFNVDQKIWYSNSSTTQVKETPNTCAGNVGNGFLRTTGSWTSHPDHTPDGVGGQPQNGDQIVIGFSDRIYFDDNTGGSTGGAAAITRKLAKVTFETKNCAGTLINDGYIFVPDIYLTNGSSLGEVSGSGTILRWLTNAAVNDVPGNGSDYSAFNTIPSSPTIIASGNTGVVNGGGTVKFYGAVAQTYTFNAPTITYPNVVLERGTGGNYTSVVFNLPATNFTTTRIFYIRQATVQLQNGSNLNIGDRLLVGDTLNGYYYGGNSVSSQLLFPSTGSANLTVNRDVVVSKTNDGGHITQINFPVGSTSTGNNFTVGRNITVDKAAGTSIFKLQGAGFNSNLTLNGNYNSVVGDTNGTHSIVFDLYNLTINKGNSSTTSVLILNPFTLSSATNQLTLQNGNLRLFSSAGAPATTITTATDFQIPATAQLTVGINNKLTFNGAGVGVRLDGVLDIEGGIVVIDDGTAAGDNHVEYGSSGFSEIDVNGGSLTVASKVRRELGTVAGGQLNYKQTAGSVVVGTHTLATNAPADRGTFEALGGNFAMSGGTLTLANSSGTVATTVPMLNIGPVGGAGATGGTIILGNASTPTTTYFGVQSSTPLWNLTLNNFHNPTATLISTPLTLGGTLNLGTGPVFNANNLDVIVKGDFIGNVAASYLPGTNTTTLSGLTQNLVGTNNFNNLTISPTTKVTVTTANQTVSGNLAINSGIFDLGGRSVTVNMDVSNSAIQQNGTVILTGGTLPHNLSGSGLGQFANFTLNDGIGALLAANQTINGVLTLTTGVLNVQGYNLALNASNAIAGAPFNASNMILSNGSFTSLGITLNLPTGALPGVPYILPISGSAAKYTPLVINSLTTSATDKLTVHPTNEEHPSIVGYTAGTHNPAHALLYYWQIDNTTSVTNANLTFQYNAADVNPAGADASDPYTDLFLGNSAAGWTNPNPQGPVNTATKQINFILSGNLGGSYTAGFLGDVPNPIPTFSNTSTGNWSTPGIWQIGPFPGGPFVGATTAPNGARVVIATGTVTLDANGLRAISTNIQPGTTLQLNGNFVGIGLGSVSGGGTVSIQPTTATAALPGGDYSGFTSGSVIFGQGASDYSIDLSTLPTHTINTVTFQGSNKKTLSQSPLTLTGNLILGDGGGSLDLATNSILLNVAGNINQTGVSPNGLNAGNSTVNFNGTSAQSINGTFAGTSAFGNISLSKTCGTNLALGGAVEVKGLLSFYNGIIQSTAANPLRFTSTGTWTTTAGSPATTYQAITSFSLGSCSYVSGPVQKVLDAGNYFALPTGDQGQVRPIGITPSGGTGITWTGQYFFQATSPYGAGNYTAPLNDIQKVGYWQVDESGVGNSAAVRLFWTPQEGFTAALGTLQVAEYIGPKWLGITSGTDVGSSLSNGSLLTTSAVNFSQHTFTIGTSSSPLPVTWYSIQADSISPAENRILWTTATELNNNKFVVERTLDLVNYFPVDSLAGAGTTQQAHTYQLVDPHAAGVRRVYYRVKQVDFDGKYSYAPIVEVDRSTEDKGLSTDAEAELWRVGPNPTAGNDLNVLVAPYSPVDEHQEHTLQLYTTTGLLIGMYTGPLQAVTPQLHTTLGQQPAGLYVLRVLSGNYQQIFRLIRN